MAGLNIRLSGPGKVLSGTDREMLVSDQYWWQIVKKQEERPSLRSVANAIRTGIFIEKIYSKMSTSQMMVIPPEVSLHLQTIENWSFDLFKFAKSANGSPLKFMGE